MSNRSLIETGMPVPFFGDGSTSRDYTYVDDIVEGVLAVECVELMQAFFARRRERST